MAQCESLDLSLCKYTNNWASSIQRGKLYFGPLTYKRDPKIAILIDTSRNGLSISNKIQ